MRTNGLGRRLSLPHLTMLDATPPELVDAAAHAGFHSVSLRLIPTMANEAQHPMLGKSVMKREVQALLASTGVTVCDIEALWLSPSSEPSQYERELEAAAELGAKCVQVISNDPDQNRLAETFSRFCETGRRFGLAMALEFMRISHLQSLEAARRVVERTRQPNALLVLDALHCFRCHTPLEELQSLRPELVGLVQLCDAPLRAPEGHEAMIREARFHRRLPGEGELPLHAWLESLPADRMIALEAPVRSEREAPTPFRQRAVRMMNGLRAFLEQHRAAGGDGLEGAPQ